MGYDGRSGTYWKRLGISIANCQCLQKKTPRNLWVAPCAMQQWTCGPAVLPHLTDEEIKHNLSFGHQNLGVLQVWSDPGFFGILIVWRCLKMFEDNFHFKTFWGSMFFRMWFHLGFIFPLKRVKFCSIWWHFLCFFGSSTRYLESSWEAMLKFPDTTSEN